MSKTEYPKQIYSTIHKSGNGTKTISVDNSLYSPTGENEERKPTPPLEMHEGFSRFVVHLISAGNGSSKCLNANIPAKEIPFIHKKTCLIMQDNLKGGNLESLLGKSNQKKETKPLAYTYKFTIGNFNGKTPAQCLLESKDNEAKLINQKNWAVNNLEKYKGKPLYQNIQDQIKAIDEAINLFKSGKLNESDVSDTTTDIITIYKCPPKNVKPIDKEGRYTVYTIEITYDKNKTLPIGIEIMNCFAPVNKSSGNVILLKDAVDKKTENMRLSEEEWYMMIDTMKAQKIMFEDYTYKKQFELSEKIAKENKEKNTNNNK